MSRWVRFGLDQIETIGEEGTQEVRTLVLGQRRGVLVLDDVAVNEQVDGWLVDLSDLAVEHNRPNDVQMMQQGRVDHHHEVWRLTVFLVGLDLVLLRLIPKGVKVAEVAVLFLLLWLHLNCLCPLVLFGIQICVWMTWLRVVFICLVF